MLMFTPVQIGKLKLRNRILMQAMHLQWADEGRVTARVIEFYRQRARGGVGMVTVGGCAIDLAGSYGPSMISLASDEYLPGFRELARAIKDEGAAASAQLFHAGRYSPSKSTRVQSMAPSAIASRLTREMPKELSAEEIKTLIKLYADSAQRAVEAGFEAVEVIAGTGYLISQFLSPVSNHRNDEYGGSFENRMRFGLEVASSIRERIGEDVPLLFRVSGHELVEGGNTHRDLIAFYRELGKGRVDAINLTTGWHESRVPQITMEVPAGAFKYFARYIKNNVDVPVVASVRINQPEIAERILAQGYADLVGMARPLLADPELPRKAMEGRADLIRPCVACNQGCLDNLFSGREVACLINPRAGRELEFPLTPSSERKKILIVGAGPAGLEAGCTSAQRGYQVTLWEKADRVGGQANLAGVPEHRADFRRLVRYYEAQLLELGVHLELNTEATPERIREFSPDALVIATGSTPVAPPIPGAHQPTVVQAWDVLRGTAECGETVVVVGGGAVGCETALHLADQSALPAEEVAFWGKYLSQTDLKEVLGDAIGKNKEVTILEMLKQVGADIGITTKWVVLQELERRGIRVVTQAEVIGIDGREVRFRHEDRVQTVKADTVVLAVGGRSNNELISKTKEEGFATYVVGDAFKPRKVLDAIKEGFEAGTRI